MVIDDKFERYDCCEVKNKNLESFNLIKSGTNNDLTDGSFAGKRRS